MSSIVEKSRDKVVLRVVYIDKEYNARGQVTNYAVKALVDRHGNANVDAFYSCVIHRGSEELMCVFWANMMGYDVVTHDEFCREYAKVLGYNEG